MVGVLAQAQVGQHDQVVPYFGPDVGDGELGDAFRVVRIAADAVGATKMDRPEWNAVNPANGEVYFTLTNNSNRSVNPTGSQYLPDAANPRAYTDMKGSSAQKRQPQRPPGAHEGRRLGHQLHGGRVPVRR